ncbi:MAG: hypothetical protein ACTHKU_10650 [Verrucomicrobiota bacterium]
MSVVINVALGLAWFILSRPCHATVPLNEEVAIPVSATPVSVQAGPATAVPPTVPSSPFTWQRIESTDYRQYMANLRATDCPEWLIRDIIVADLDALPIGLSAASFMPLPPWANADRRRARELEERNRSAAAHEAKRAAVQQLLGYEWDYRSGDIFTRSLNQEMMYGFLPDEKAGKLATLIEKHKLQASAIREAAHQILIPEDFARIRDLQQRVELEAAQFLTSAELEEFKLRAQAVDYLFKGEVGARGVRLSGAEFRELARISRIPQNSFAELISEEKQPSAEDLGRRNREFQQQLEALLGPNRLSAGILK